jgi:hypothetical protein
MARPRATEPEPDLEGLEDWGSPPEDDEEGDPGEPPELPAIATEPAVPPSEALAALGPPPKGTLAAEKWAHSVLMQQAYETMMSDMPESARRREVRTILRDARGHVTDAARYDYMKLVERDRAELEARKRGHASAESVAVGAPPAGAKIIPMIKPDDAS